METLSSLSKNWAPCRISGVSTAIYGLWDQSCPFGQDTGAALVYTVDLHPWSRIIFLLVGLCYVGDRLTPLCIRHCGWPDISGPWGWFTERIISSQSTTSCQLVCYTSTTIFAEKRTGVIHMFSWSILGTLPTACETGWLVADSISDSITILWQEIQVSKYQYQYPVFARPGKHTYKKNLENHHV